MNEKTFRFDIQSLRAVSVLLVIFYHFNFNISDVQKAGAIFDITKLDWLNTQHIANLSFEDFKKELKPFLKDFFENNFEK